MEKLLKIIHAGPAYVLGTAVQRAQALADLGHCMTRVLTARPAQHGRTFVKRVLFRLGYPAENCGENAALIARAAEVQPDVVWIEKGLTIRPATLKAVRRAAPGALIVSSSPDDMMNPSNQSRYWLACVPLYDLHVTTKTHNIQELCEAGARRVEFMPKAYDPHTHRPVALTEEDRRAYGADVGFVGAHERERARSISFLARNGIPVRVWGGGWDAFAEPRENVRLERREVYGDEYAKALCATKINLGFLRKVNRDRQTARSIEIPACGAFMLAERTEEHLGLFREGVEAEFFSSDEELLQKTRYYLSHDEERLRIGLAGRERCLRDGYSNADRLAKVLNTCRAMLKERRPPNA